MNRRQAILGLSSAILLPSCALQSARDPATQRLFAHGVASGDPTDTDVVLWTRVSGKDTPVRGAWDVAETADFREIVASGRFVTDSDIDFTVKPVAAGLEPGRQYYYRFEVDGVMSMIGRTRTLPVGPVARLGIAVASCSNYAFGCFNAYDLIAADPSVDFVLHLGDYIYEHGPDGYGGSTGAQIDRNHDPRKEIVTLADYRARHAQYKSDPASQAMHGAYPLIATWDDHESANNPWTDGAQNHQPGEEGAWSERRQASLRAYFEWMPVRDPPAGRTRAAYWRRFRFGDLASLVLLETRHTARSKQVDYADHGSALADKAAAARFRRDVLGAPGRRMIADEMQDFLRDRIRESVAANQPWRLIGNQIPMARTHVPPLDDFLEEAGIALGTPESAYLDYLLQLQGLELPISLDTWDGYPAAREQLYRTCAEVGARDLLVLTGDSHKFWANELEDQAGHPMGLELGTAGITSPGDFGGLSEPQAARLETVFARCNPEVTWMNSRHNGYIRLQLTKDSARADYVTVSNVLSREYEAGVLRSVGIRRRAGTLRYTRLA